MESMNTYDLSFNHVKQLTCNCEFIKSFIGLAFRHLLKWNSLLKFFYLLDIWKISFRFIKKRTYLGLPDIEIEQGEIERSKICSKLKINVIRFKKKNKILGLTDIEVTQEKCIPSKNFIIESCVIITSNGFEFYLQNINDKLGKINRNLFKRNITNSLKFHNVSLFVGYEDNLHYSQSLRNKFKKIVFFFN